MVFDTNREKGNSGLGMAIAYYSCNGYTVSIPLNDTQDYDLIVERDGILKTVQVKSSGCLSRQKKYQVALRSCGGTVGKTYKTFIDTKVDIIFILTADMQMYEIPKVDIKNRNTLNICDKYLKYKVYI